MQCALNSLPPRSDAPIPSSESGINASLSFALEYARQVSFDWHIPNDRLCFGKEQTHALKASPRNTTNIYKSSTFAALIHSGDQSHFKKCLRDALKGTGNETGSFYRIELRLKDPIRVWRWVDISGKIVQRDAAGKAIHMVGFFHDIDKRKRAEMKVERLRDLYATSSQINQILMRVSDRDFLFREICRLAVELGHFHTAWIGVIRSNGQAVLPITGYDVCAGAWTESALRINHSKPHDQRVINAHLLEGQSIVCNDIYSTDLPRHWLTVMPEPEPAFGAIACFPFQLPGEAIGVLHLHDDERNFFDTSVIQLLEEITSDLSFALYNHARARQGASIKAAPVSNASLKSSVQNQSQHVLPDSALRYRHLVEISPEAMFVYRGTTLVLVNRAAARLLSAEDDAHSLLGRNILDFVHPDYHELLHGRARMSPEGSTPSPFLEQVWMRPDTTELHVEIAATNLLFEGEPSVQLVVRDITERKRSEALQCGQNRILNMVATGSLLTEILTEIAYFAESQSKHSLCAIQQWNRDGTMVGEPVAPNMPAACLARITAMTAGTRNDSCDKAILHSEEPVIVMDIASDPLWRNFQGDALTHGLKAYASWPLFGKHQNVLGNFAFYFRELGAPSQFDCELANICANLAGIAIDSRMSEDRIRYLAHYDGLTSLPNRFLFNEHLGLALRNARRHASKFAVFFLDLDKFKEVNDTLGHAAGDQVLREIANRLRNCLRHSDKIARMGGDEFYILIEDLNDGRYAADVAKKLLDAACTPVQIQGQNCRLSASIGIAIYPDNGKDGQALLKNADSAMYLAKKMGKNTYRFYATDVRGGTSDIPDTPSSSLRISETEMTLPKRLQ